VPDDHNRHKLHLDCAGYDSAGTTAQERLALAGFLAGYTGLTREAYTLDLRQFAGWCRQHDIRLFGARRADIECFARDLEARGRARATVTRRLCTVAGFYRYAVEEELPDHSPATGRSLQLAGECPLDQSAVVVDQARQGPQVNDSAVAGRDKVDDLADRRGVLVARHDQGARRDLGRVSGLVQERPQVTGVVLVIEVSSDIDPVHFSPPLARHQS
jgi:Phage integrase, N-terminal SAM-like domain